MAFTFGAFTYITALIVDAFLLFFSIFHVSIMVVDNIFRITSQLSLFMIYSLWLSISSKSDNIQLDCDLFVAGLGTNTCNIIVLDHCF